MTLKDTVEMMNSDDYKERFKAEYYQLVTMRGNLPAKEPGMLAKWDEGTLNFEPTCPRNIYNTQIKAMVDYIEVLKARAIMEGIDL